MFSGTLSDKTTFQVRSLALLPGETLLRRGTGGGLQGHLQYSTPPTYNRLHLAHPQGCREKGIQTHMVRGLSSNITDDRVDPAQLVVSRELSI